MKKKISTLRISAFLLSALLCFSLTGCGGTQTQPAESAAPAVETAAPSEAPVVSNVNIVGSYAELRSAQPTVLMNDVPSGSSNVSYSWINNIPVICSISFSYQGSSYEYRAAYCPGGSASSDISGVSAEIKAVASLEVAEENAAGGSCVLRYNVETGEGVANWTSALSNCQYSLHTNNGCLGDVSTMNMYQVVKQLYVCVPDLKTVEGAVVQSVSGKSVTVTLPDNTTAAIDCGNISRLSVTNGDIVTISYSGDLAGSALGLSFTKTGEAKDLAVSGTVFGVYDSYFYLLTADQNVYSINTNKSTAISGVAKKLASQQEVSVKYTGDINEEALATEITINKAGVTPTVSPAATAAPGKTPVPTSSVYTDRTISGLVTACAGNYVTVNGVQFVVNSSECYVSGKMAAGNYATINYRDYGNYFYKVTSAYFTQTGYTPTPVPYTEHSCAGTITYVNGIYIGIEGGWEFTVNGANCVVSGTATVGGYAMIYYRDYGYGYYEVTSASFSQPEISSWIESGYGEITNYSGLGGYLSIGNIQAYPVAYNCVVSGVFYPGCYASYNARVYSNGTVEVVQIDFYN